MFRSKFLWALGLMLAWGVSAPANAGTMVLDSFIDQAPATINLPAAQLLMATVNTTGTQGGNDATATTVSIGGTVVPADLASVCVDYAGAQVGCLANPAVLSNIVLNLGGNQKGGSAFDYRVTLNASAGGKTIVLTVVSVTNTILQDNIPLPQSTATRSIAGANAPPTLTSPTFANVTATTATLGGTVTDAGVPATVTSRGVEWSTSPGGPYTSVTAGSAGTGTFTVPVSGLPAATTIYFRAWATNSGAETGYSAESTFTTLAVAPTVITPTFANVTDSTATLGGTVTDAGAPPTLSTCGVEWGTAPGAYPNSVPGGTPCTVGSPFTVAVSSLPASTTIYFRAWATNSGSATGYSAENSFTTLAPAVPPTVSVAPAAGIGQNSATLGGNVTDDGGAPVTARGIVWNTSSPAEAGGTVVSMGSGLGAFSQAVSGLPAGTLIYVKAWATNSAGTAYSPTEESFTTLAGLPTVVSPTATNITATSATLGGTVSSDGGGALTDCGVQWGTSNGGPYPGSQSFGACAVGTPFSVPVAGLTTGVTVYYRAFATNSAGTAYSVQASFTPAGPPTVTVTPATSITDTTAVLGGNVTDSGGATVSARGIVWNTTSPPEIGGTVVTIGSGLGAFSQVISGLPPQTLVYFKAWATNAAATSYSAESSFTTQAPAGPIQASNVTFTRVTAGSFYVNWTRGNGAGSIVVLRLTGTPRVDPVNGVDYLPDPEFGLVDLTGSSGNFVVFKAAGRSIWVTGLAPTTSYTAAVYEYSGTGAGTVYVPNPAEGTQSTSDVAAHNSDYRVDCSDCHYHGSFGARGPELKAVCETCHNATGVAADKLAFDNHLAPNRNPAIDQVDCGMCHELHMPGVTNTTVSTHSITSVTQQNKSFLRANVNKYVPGAATPAYLHTDEPGNNPDRAVEGGDDTTARGYCQVCHTQTNYHRSSSTTLANQCHDGAGDTSCGPEQVHCGSCHEHTGSFAATGGGSCTGCHSSPQGSAPVRQAVTVQFDRLSSHISGGSAVVASEDCESCHDQSSHMQKAVKLLDGDTGASYPQPTAGAPTLATGQGEAFAPACLSCHDANGASRLAGIDQTPSSPFTGSGAPPVIDAAAWANAGHNRPSGTFPASPVTCLGDGVNGCHGSGHGSEQLSLLAPAAGPTVSATDFCFTCHDGDGPSSKNIQAAFARDTSIRTTSASGALVNQGHDITASEQSYSGGAVTCKNCHSTHVNNSANPVADPDTGVALRTYSPANVYNEDGFNFSYRSAAGNLDPVNPEGATGGPYTEPDYIQFCLACHDGTAPPGVTLSPGLLNMGTAYPRDKHGTLAGNTGSKTGKGGLKMPWVSAAANATNNDPSAPYAALNCTICHDAHGSGNIFSLRTSITVDGQALTVGGVGVLNEPQYSGSTTYTLPLINGKQTDHYWGAWCTFCHKVDSHPGKVEADACTGGHMHGGGAF